MQDEEASRQEKLQIAEELVLLCLTTIMPPVCPHT